MLAAAITPFTLLTCTVGSVTHIRVNPLDLGQAPRWLRFFRVLAGPNPTFIAGNYHWFDGDGTTCTDLTCS